MEVGEGPYIPPPDSDYKNAVLNNVPDIDVPCIDSDSIMRGEYMNTGGGRLIETVKIKTESDGSSFEEFEDDYGTQNEPSSQERNPAKKRKTPAGGSLRDQMIDLEIEARKEKHQATNAV
ncbi:hypothetical protein M8J75_002050 [Diaphorina citri]|nr:hypothetical protein M8J75_002050 [Diaphorina citri]